MRRQQKNIIHSYIRIKRMYLSREGGNLFHAFTGTKFLNWQHSFARMVLRLRRDDKLSILSHCDRAILYFFMFLCSTAIFAGDWISVAPGIEYTDIGNAQLSPWSHLHVFKINLKQHQPKIDTAAHYNRNTTTVSAITPINNAYIGINGGFFDNNARSLGLRITKNKELSPLKKISWWGVLYTKNQHGYLASASHFKPNRNIDFAIQGGPRLIINGEIPRLKPGVAERTALGLTADKQHLLILVTDHYPLTTSKLAELFQAPPLNCVEALNLDGGSSTQLYANFPHLKLNIPGLSGVSDFILI